MTQEERIAKIQEFLNKDLSGTEKRLKQQLLEADLKLKNARNDMGELNKQAQDLNKSLDNKQAEIFSLTSRLEALIDLIVLSDDEDKVEVITKE